MNNNNKKIIIISLPLVLATILTIAAATSQVVYVQGQDGGISDACLINPSVCGLEGTIERQEESSQLMEEAMREVQEEQATQEEDEEDEEAVQEEDEEIEGTLEEGVRLYENGTGVISYGALRVTFNWTQTSGDPIVFEGGDITFQNGTVLLS
jgi:membrane protein involved in colicin uptake